MRYWIMAQKTMGEKIDGGPPAEYKSEMILVKQIIADDPANMQEQLKAWIETQPGQMLKRHVVCQVVGNASFEVKQEFVFDKDGEPK